MAELKNALVGLGKVIPRRSTLPILGAIKIERNAEGWIALTSTDLDRFVTVRLEQPADGEPTSVLLPFDELVKTSKACGKTDTIFVRAEDEESGLASIISYPVGDQQVEHRCDSFRSEEFPEIPRFRSEAIALPPALRTSIHEAFACASTDETRYILNGAFIDVSGAEGHYVVATDGRQLFSSNSFKLPLAESLLIPTHRFLSWKEFSSDGEWRLKVGQKTKEQPAPFQLTSRRWRFISKQIEGNYPNWRQVMLNGVSFISSVELDPEALPQIIQTIERMPCHDEVNHTIGLEVNGANLALLGKPPGAEQWTKVAVEPAQTRGREMIIMLNREYLTKALRFGLNKIEIIDAMSPLRLSHAGRQMIIMPVRHDAANRPSATPTPAEETGGPGSSPSAPETEQPAATQAAQPEKKPMPSTTPESIISDKGTDSVMPAETKSFLELALEQIETVKSSCRENGRALTSLADLIKQAQREQKTSDKEISSVRQTLRSLQSVRI